MATKSNLPNRGGSTFLIKPVYEGKTQRCYRKGFCDSRKECGGCDSNTGHGTAGATSGATGHGTAGATAEATEATGHGTAGATTGHNPDKHPIFYLQERFTRQFPGYEWNGFLLYAIHGTADARKVALANRSRLHIILSFDDPDSDRYFILIDSGTGGGSAEEFRQWRDDVRDMQLAACFHQPAGHDLDYFSRVFSPDHYDIVDWDVLFGNDSTDESDGPSAPDESDSPSAPNESDSPSAPDESDNRNVSTSESRNGSGDRSVSDTRTRADDASLQPDAEPTDKGQLIGELVKSFSGIIIRNLAGAILRNLLGRGAMKSIGRGAMKSIGRIIRKS